MKQNFVSHILLCLCLLAGIKASAYDAYIDGIYYNFSGDAATVTSDHNPNYYSGDVVIPAYFTYSGKTYRVTRIGASAFYNCTSLTSVTIGKNVTTIENVAFRNCTSLTSINIPESVKYIQASAFWGCSSLTSVHIVDLEAWLNISFGDYLGDIYSNPLSYAHHLYLDGKEITDISIPNNITRISRYAFYNCKGLRSVTIPESVTSIGDFAFCDCSGLTSITIPSSVTEIGGSAFAGCEALDYVRVKNATPVKIDQYTFSSRQKAFLRVPFDSKAAYEAAPYWDEFMNITEDPLLIDGIYYDLDKENMVAEVRSMPEEDGKYYGEIVIPSLIMYNDKTYSVTSIGDSAFDDCIGLTSVIIPNSVISIDSYAFRDCSSLTSVNIPNSITSIGGYAFNGCSGLTSIKVEEGNVNYDSRNDCNAIIETATNALIQGCQNTIIPNDVTSIGNHAFSGCSGLTSITIPNSVTSIGDHAFYGCSGLTTVTIPESVISIGYSAFRKCSSLTSVTIPNGVTSIDDYCFSGCSGLTSITIPNSVTSIGRGAFRNCIITTITIPESVTSIGESAFNECTSLISVTIPNSVTSIGSGAFFDCISLTSVRVKNATPVAIKESTFTNRANATLYVPTGSKAAYKAAPYWNEFKEFVEDWVATDISGMENVLYLDDAEAIADGGLATLKVKMKNSVTSEGFHFDMYLPEGCHFAFDEIGEIDAELNYRRASTSNMFFDTHLNDDGSLNVNVSSKKAGKVIADNDGVVMFVRIIVDDGIAIGECPIILKNWGVTDDLGWVWPDTNNAPVTYPLGILDLKRGDANKDKGTKLNSGDYTTILHFILNLPYRQIDMTAADVNGDGNVDVADLSTLADLIKKQGR